MKQFFFVSLGLTLLISLFISTSQVAFGAGNDGVITPIPQINKEFLIVVHIIMDKDSSAGISEDAVKASIALAAAYFEPMGAKFTVCEFRYIYNFNYNDLNGPRKNDLFALYKVKNRINMFFSSTFIDVGVSTIGICGLATLGGINDADNGAVLILKGDCSNDQTIAHELGHYFSLEHTFEDSHGLELADGSNCDTAGDNICDTPADPYVVGKNIKLYLNGCTFIYTDKDANGHYYSPKVENIMSYYPNCRCPVFTHGQYVKMANYYLSNPIAW